MDTHQYPGLVYHQHPGSLPPSTLPAGGQSYSTTVLQSPQQMSWQSSHSPPNSSSSTSSDHQMFSALNRTTDHVDYPSQSSPISYLPRHPQNPVHQQSQQFTASDSPHDVQFTSSQIESSIGPARVLTRRRARAVVDEQGGHPPLPDDSFSHSIHYPSSQMPRPGSPNVGPHHAPPPPYSESPERQPRDGAPTRPGPLFPLTPVSGAQTYSPYTFYPTHSRSTSGSGSGIMSNPRSASPTLSTASGLTSVSSSASAPPPQNSQVPLGPNPPVPTRPKHRKQRLYNVDRKKICIYHRDHPNVKQEEIARTFGVERSTISKILKHKQKWLNVPEETPVLLARQRPTKFPYLEMRLEKWLRECHAKQTIFTDALIRDRARALAKEMDWPEEKFKASSGWVENFKHRHNIRKGVWHGFPKSSLAPAPLAYNVPYDYNGQLDTTQGQLPSSFVDQAVGQADKEPDHDMGIESEDDGEGDSNGISLQPAWGDPTPASVLAPTVEQLMHGSQDPSAVVVTVDVPQVPNPHEPLPADLPPPEPVPIPIRREDGHSDVAYVIPKPPTYRPAISEPPSMNEVEDAIDKVITFVENQPKDFLDPRERVVLTNIKCALFQLANGLPYSRDDR